MMRLSARVFLLGHGDADHVGPPAASLWISAMHLSISCVYARVIVWTETGAGVVGVPSRFGRPPPIFT